MVSLTYSDISIQMQGTSIPGDHIGLEQNQIMYDGELTMHAFQIIFKSRLYDFSTIQIFMVLIIAPLC